MRVLLDHKKFRQALFEKQFTHESFAERTEISDRHVRNLSSKDTNVTINVFYKICTVLEIPMESLLSFHEDKK